MQASTIAHGLTIFAGVAFLGSLLWSNALLDGLSFLLSTVSLGLFLVSLLTSVAFLLFKRSKLWLHLLLINVLICLLVFPTAKLGSLLKDRLFLTHLEKFQEVTNLLIENARAANKEKVFRTGAQLPDKYSSLHTSRTVLLDFTPEGVSVRYFTRDTSALGGSGYLYRSDDDPVALKKDFPRLGFKRLAPHWFFFAD